MTADALRNQLLTLISREAALPSIGGLHGKIWQQVRPHLLLTASVRSAGTPGALSERQLARRLAAGEAAAFDALVEMYAGKLLRYAQRSLAPADAEDVVQEAFVVVVRKAQELADHPNLPGFLYQTVRYLIVDVLRRQERHALAVATEPRDEHADDVTAAVIRAQDLQRVAQALHDVCNPLEQEVMALTLEEWDPRDISQQLDMTVNHVRVIKHRAVQKLRGALEVDYERH